jgi:hypothetical protein
MADQSALLMTYTTFHIGAYLTIGAAAIAIVKEREAKLNKLFFLCPLLCFFVAGISGGIIASNLPDYNSFNDFKDKDIGFWAPFITL